MDPTAYAQLKTAVQEALERPAAERLSFLRRRLAGSPELLADAEALLAFHVDAGTETEASAGLPDMGFDLAPGLHVGHYELREEIGRGGMGIVWKAWDAKLKRTVAIKFLPRDATLSERRRAMFLEEAQLASSVAHAHIVHVYDIGREAGRDYIVMEHVEGAPLSQLLRDRSLSIHELLDIGVQLSSALDRAHRKGLVHRDLKPANILVTADGDAKLVDFGIAALFAERQGEDPMGSMSEADSPLDPIGRPPAVAGTLPYMSPEQVRGAALDPRSDLFSLGVVLHEMMTGERPFKGDTPTELLGDILVPRSHLGKDVAPEIPARLVKIVRKALAPDIGERYQRAEELGAELTRLKRDLEAKRRPDPRVLAGFALLAVALATTGWILWRSGSSDPQLRVAQTRKITHAVGLEVDPAISPDGTLLAYAAGPLGATRIYCRSLDTDETILLGANLPGYQRWPRWSPSGTQLVFQSVERPVDVEWHYRALGEKLYIASVTAGAGEPVEVVTPVPSPASPAWSPDGEYLAYVCENQIYRQPVTGGEAALLLDAAEPHSLAWSPNGAFLAFVSGNPAHAFGRGLFANRAPSSLHLLSLSSRELTTVASEECFYGSPAWGPDGRTLSFVSDIGGPADIYRVLLDAEGNVRAEPQRLTTGLNVHTVSIDRSRARMFGSQLTFSANVWSIDLFGSQGAVPVQRTFGSQVIEEFDLAPQRSWLAFDANLHGNTDIFTMKVGTDSPIALTTDPADDFLPVWSRDGTLVAFHSFRTGSRDVFVTSADGEKLDQVTDDPSHEWMADWSPRNDELLLFSDRTGQPKLYICERDGSGIWSEPRLLTPGPSERSASWSPDGSTIAFIADNCLQTVTATGGEKRVLLCLDDLSETQSISFGRWSRDGRQIYLRAVDQRGKAEFWAVSPADGAAASLVRFDDSAKAPTRLRFSVDETSIYFVAGEYEGDLWQFELATEE